MEFSRARLMKLFISGSLLDIRCTFAIHSPRILLIAPLWILFPSVFMASWDLPLLSFLSFFFNFFLMRLKFYELWSWAFFQCCHTDIITLLLLRKLLKKCYKNFVKVPKTFHFIILRSIKSLNNIIFTWSKKLWKLIIEIKIQNWRIVEENKLWFLIVFRILCIANVSHFTFSMWYIKCKNAFIEHLILFSFLIWQDRNDKYTFM